MVCKKHPTYLGHGEPRLDCLDCWKIYGKYWRMMFKNTHKLFKDYYEDGKKLPEDMTGY